MKPLSIDQIPDNHPLHPRTEIKLDARFQVAVLNWLEELAKLIKSGRHPHLTIDCLCYHLRNSGDPNETQADIAKRNKVTGRTVARELARVRRHLVKK